MDASSQHVAAAFSWMREREGTPISGLRMLTGRPKEAVSAAERRRPFHEYRTGGIGYGEVKARLADAIDAHVAPMRNRYQRLLSDPTELDSRLAKGERHARQRADRRLARTMVAMGL
jgi:hypothetical protein